MSAITLRKRARREAYAAFDPSDPVSAHSVSSMHWLDAAKLRHPSDSVEAVKAVWRVCAIFACYPLFWALFDQQVCPVPCSLFVCSYCGDMPVPVFVAVPTCRFESTCRRSGAVLCAI